PPLGPRTSPTPRSSDRAGGVRRGRGDRGGAAARRAARTGGGAGQQLTYIKRQIPLYEVLNEEGLALIEANADTVLEEIGIEFREDRKSTRLNSSHVKIS